MRLQLSSASLSRSGRQIVADVSLSLAPGEQLLIAGANGSGKTSVLNLLSGHLRPDKGSRLLDGRDVSGWTATQMARAGVVRVMQRAAILPDRTALENVVMLNSEGWIRGWFTLANVPSNGVGEKATAMLGALGYVHPVNGVVPDEPLAVRTVELARVLMLDPWIVLLDEPMAGLGPRARGDILGLLALLRKRGTACVLVEHHLQEAGAVVDRVLRMDEGRIVAA